MIRHLPPLNIPIGTKLCSCDLLDGLKAVKLAMCNDNGEQLYGVYDGMNHYCGELLTLSQVISRKESNS